MNSTILIVLISVAVVVLVVILRKRKAAPEDEGQSSSTSTGTGAPGQSADSGKAGKEPTGTPPGSTPDDDRVVLQQLREAGSDLNKPHQIEFYLYFPTEEAAGKAAEKLEAEGFEGEMRRAPDLTRWMCLVHQQMVPELSKIAALKRRLAKLAQEFGGEYDGWETDIEK
jgi:regulator of RNase E activity RraB